MADTTTIPLLLLLLAATVAAAAELSVYHNVHPSSPSPLESIIALARDDDARLLFLSSKAATAGVSSAPVASGQAPPSYVVRAGLGSPSQQLLLALDTSADATWAHCSPCGTCPSSSLFAPANSSSYASLPCSSSWCPLFQGQACPAPQGGGDAAPPPAMLPTCAFSKPFADASFQAALASDTLRLGKDAIPNYTFGSATPLACLAMAEAPQNVNSVVNVIANLQQQNIRVVFDVANSRVGFAKESCN
uniref:Peptidase A1 domain-containing protein n=1 Tax=Oryza barthii TaxID=65489 RepID=A0A0D3FER8_9ORYZ